MAASPIQVISLARTPERFQAFRADNPDIAVECVPAVDGSLEQPRALVAAGVIDPALAYTPGALGCALSHIGLWRACAAGRAPLTICEDDAVLRADFEQASLGVLDQAPGAELVLWGWNFDSVLAGRLFGDTPFAMGFDQVRLRGSLPAFRVARDRPTLLRLHRALGTPCYTITPTGAERLLGLCLPLRPQEVYVPLLDRQLANTGLDIAMNAAYPMIEAYVAFPPLAVTRNEAGGSTVEPPIP